MLVFGNAMGRERRSVCFVGHHSGVTTGADDFEIEFRWKEEVIYWEGKRGCFFPGAWALIL